MNLIKIMLPLIFLCIVLIVIILTIIIFYITKQNAALKKENAEVKKHEQQTVEIITEANKTKAEARTGNHSADIKYMADKLHDYAKK